jgi:glucose/arabinose dehydrogenase
MKSRFVVISSLLTLAACSGGGDDGSNPMTAGGTTGVAGTTSGAGNNAGGAGNGNAGTASGGTQNNGGGGTVNGGNGGTNVGGTNPGGTGGTDPGGAGGVSGGGAGAGAGGQINIPSTCGMPVLGTAPANTCRNAAPPALKMTELAGTDALFAPLMLASPPGDNSRLFIITRDGLVHIYKDGALLPTPFADITAIVPANNGANEYGLLGLAFDPAFTTNGRVWLSYCADTTVPNSYCKSTAAYVTASAANPDVAESNTPTPVVEVDQPNNDNHKGGMINFGPDGCLYMSFGDGGNQGDPNGNGQNTDEPMASILRVDPATGMAAPGNPGYGDPRIWVYGLRNPWRTSFDRGTGDFYIGDVGQGTWEEIDIAPAGVGDFNFGWNVAEGPDGDQTGKRSPAVSHDHGEAHSMTGGYVYRGAAIPDLVGRYVYADYDTSKYWVLTYSGEENGQNAICDQAEVTADLDIGGKPVAFGEDNSGELYVMMLEGPIYKIEAGP